MFPVRVRSYCFTHIPKYILTQRRIGKQEYICNVVQGIIYTHTHTHTIANAGVF